MDVSANAAKQATGAWDACACHTYKVCEEAHALHQTCSTGLASHG